MRVGGQFERPDRPNIDGSRREQRSRDRPAWPANDEPSTARPRAVRPPATRSVRPLVAASPAARSAWSTLAIAYGGGVFSGLSTVVLPCLVRAVLPTRILPSSAPADRHDRRHDHHARGAVPRLRAGIAGAAVDRDRRPDAGAPSRRPPHLWRGISSSARRAGRQARSGRARRRAACDRAGQPRARRQALRDADLVGRDPVPDAGRETRPSTATHSTHSGSSSRAKACGRWSMGTRWHVARRLPAQAGWNWHAHHNATAEPMAWIDGLDIPFQYLTEASSSRGREQISEAERTTPERSRSERLGATRGCGRSSASSRGAGAPGTPLLAYRWEDTDRALTEQLATRRRGRGGTVEPGHAAVRFTNPATGGDVLPTIRAEMHRIVRGARTAPAARWARRSIRSSTARAR